MIEARRCDECHQITTLDLVEAAIEESAGTVQTMTGPSRMYTKSILRICSRCVMALGEDYAGREDTGAVDQTA